VGGGGSLRRMRGIVSWGAYLPYRRLDRSQIAPLVGQGGGRGTRTVASFDEDPATMAVEAGRIALAGSAAVPDTVVFGSVVPAYADKTNATVVHAALRLPDTTAAFDLGSSTRSVVGGLLMALRGGGTTVVTAGDIRGGLAGSAEEAAGGDAAAAALVGDDHSDAPVLAEVLATASRTAEFVDRWRTPGETRSKVWDEKYAEVTYRPLGLTAWQQALDAAGLTPADVALAAVSGPTTRIASSVAGRLGAGRTVDDLAATVGITGAAHPLLLLASLLEQAEPNQVIALVSLADGADVVLLRTTAALARHRPRRTVAEQVAAGGALPYGRFLGWRQVLAVEPPRRPEPQRVSATAAARSEDWKFGFVASRDRTTGTLHLPPARVSTDGERTDEMDPAPMADVPGTVATFTIDRVAYSPSPPIVFAVVDFDGGGRLPVELCDCDADEVQIGARVEMTFRRLGTTDGLPNYFWKARLVRQPSTLNEEG
jgi:hydroxymethylglutaryl-CoA synthase